MASSVILPPDLTERTEQIAQACKAIYRETRLLHGKVNAAGCRFPDTLDIVLSDLSTSTDRLFLLLNPKLISSAQDSADGSDRIQHARGEAPTQDGR